MEVAVNGNSEGLLTFDFHLNIFLFYSTEKVWLAKAALFLYKTLLPKIFFQLKGKASLAYTHTHTYIHYRQNPLH